MRQAVVLSQSGEGMAETKTTATAVDPADFITAVEPPAKREDAQVLDAMFRRLTGGAPQMWGPTIVGYGSYHYRYASGREGRSPRVGFSPRSASLSLYGLTGHAGSDELLARLGKHRLGAGCLYVNKLTDIDLDVLRELIALGWTARAASS